VTTTNGQIQTSDAATIWRWREQYQNDFAARMNWCVATTYAAANHNPIAVLDGDHTKNPIYISATNGAEVPLTAEGTGDPDGNRVKETWWIYTEAGSVSGAVLSATAGLKTVAQLPRVKKGGELHVILQVEDNGTPPLSAYRRAIIHVSP
jgi:hypothetical protein